MPSPDSISNPGNTVYALICRSLLESRNVGDAVVVGDGEDGNAHPGGLLHNGLNIARRIAFVRLPPKGLGIVMRVNLEVRTCGIWRRTLPLPLLQNGPSRSLPARILSHLLDGGLPDSMVIS